MPRHKTRSCRSMLGSVTCSKVGAFYSETPVHLPALLQQISLDSVDPEFVHISPEQALLCMAG